MRFVAEFGQVDLAVPVLMVAMMVGAVLAAFGVALRRSDRPVLAPAGVALLAAAGFVLILGAWTGLHINSADQINRERAAAGCAADHPRFVAWERSGNS